MMAVSLPRILLIEDNPADIELAKIALELNDIHAEVVSARDGQKAIDMLTEMGAGPIDGYPDLILIDINMPRVGGLDVLRFIKQHATLHPIPAIVLTTSDAPQDRTRSFSLGANDYLVKPPRLDDFVRLLQRLAPLLKQP
jgi:two-component system response regulator